MDRVIHQWPAVEPLDQKVEIFYFFDPFSDVCREMEPIINKLIIEYREYVTIQKILAPSLTVLTKCQAQSTSDQDNLALAYKAAEVQGRNKARAFMRYILNRIVPTKSVCTYDHMLKSAELAGLDVQSFFEEINSSTVKSMLKRDLAVYREMDIGELPAMVFFSGDVHEEGIKVEGTYPYHIFTYIINELLEFEVEKKPLPGIYDYIESFEVVSFHELKTVFEWRTGLLVNELNKLKLKRMIDEVVTDETTYYQVRGGTEVLNAN